MVVRRAINAGSWYEGDANRLKKYMNYLFTDKEYGPGEEPKTLNLEKRTIIGGVSPHAGHRYSGRCAAHTYLNLFKERIPDTVIILGTVHTMYHKIAVFPEGEWETPLGNLRVDDEFTSLLLENSNVIIGDYDAFTGYNEREHNIEIQLPFIKYCAGDKDVQIVPLKLGFRRIEQFDLCEKIAKDLVSTIKKVNKDIVIVASSDMMHEDVYNEEYLKKFKRIEKDVVDTFVELDPKKFFNKAVNLSICGPQTITTMMIACKLLGAVKAKALQHYTSCESEKTLGYCVGYFSGILLKE